MLEDLLLPSVTPHATQQALIDKAIANIRPVEILAAKKGFSFLDEGKIYAEIYPINSNQLRRSAWVLECQERNENNLALKRMQESLRQVLEGEKIQIGTLPLLFG